MKYFNIVIVRLDRTIQNLMKTLDSPIKSGNDEYKKFNCLLSGLIKRYIRPFVHAVNRIYSVVLDPRLADGKISSVPEEYPRRICDDEFLSFLIQAVSLFFVQRIPTLLYQCVNNGIGISCSVAGGSVIG